MKEIKLRIKSVQSTMQITKAMELVASSKLNRAKEFENYDVYDAHQIAQDAVIYEQGGYLIMLMLADTDAARDVIDQYIPKI